MSNVVIRGWIVRRHEIRDDARNLGIRLVQKLQSLTAAIVPNMVTPVRLPRADELATRPAANLGRTGLIRASLALRPPD